MCGILAIHLRKQEEDLNGIFNGWNMLSNRGPDAGSFSITENVLLGFKRLSIMDPSPLGNQPFEWGGVRVICNGEIYNHIELRMELEGLGYIFQSHSDTEVILAAYKYWGIRCLNRFIGMWAIAIWDIQENSIFLARDPFGIKPLYYSWKEGRFAFASEIKTFNRTFGS